MSEKANGTPTMPRKRATTIHDIARVAGVSASTVSRVLNGNTPVTAEKRAAVLAAIDGLKFRPNVVAQGLARNRSMAIGVLTQDIASPFYGEILKGIEQGLRGSAYHPVFASGNWNTEEEIEALDMLIGRRVDAIILLGGQVPDEHLQQVAKQVPLVALGREITGMEDRCLHVEDAQGGYTATRYLIELGHRRIAHITGLLSHRDAVDRRDGYMRALVEAGLEVDQNLIVEGHFDEQSGLLAVEALLSRAAMFTAIFAGNDQMAYGARLALYRRGIRVPEDISIVGFDDQPGSAYTTPPLTTIRLPTIKMGGAAAQAILRMVEGQPPMLPTFATELVIRESAALRR